MSRRARYQRFQALLRLCMSIKELHMYVYEQAGPLSALSAGTSAAKATTAHEKHAEQVSLTDREREREIERALMYKH